MLGYCDCIVLWMPRSQTNLLAHVSLDGLSDGICEDALHTFPLIWPQVAYILATLVHEFDIHGSVSIIGHVYNMHVGVVRPGDYHA